MLTDSSYNIACFKLLEPILTLDAWPFAHTFLEFLLRFWEWLKFITWKINYFCRLCQKGWVLTFLSCQGVSHKTCSFKPGRIDLFVMIYRHHRFFLFIIIRIWPIYSISIFVTIRGSIIEVPRISHIIFLFEPSWPMLWFGLRMNLQPLITRNMVWWTLLALDHGLSSKSSSRCFYRSWTTMMMKIVLILIAVIGTHLIIRLYLKYFLVLTGRSCSYGDARKRCPIWIKRVLIILLFHAGVLPFGMSIRCFPLLHVII